MITDKKDIATAFNEYFATIGEKMSADIPLANVPFTQFLNSVPRCDESMEFDPIDQIEVANIVKGLKNSKACGHDELSTEIIKHLAPVLLLPLAVTINAMFAEGKFPSFLKISKVIPVHKKGDTDCLSNYRPIALLPIFAKIFEKALCSRLQGFLDRTNFFSASQYGFRKNHNTIDALLELVGRTVISIDQKDFALAVALDISKAFDSMPHAILLQKLESAGICGIALQLMRSYLSDRFQYVVYDGFHSTRLPIVLGVPQGSVLGPL